MLVFEVELLQGSYRADPDGSAPTGRQTYGEWPPAPARLLAALIAADGISDQPGLTGREELEFLAAADPPVILADPDTHHQPLEERYVAGQDRVSHQQQQEYLLRKGVLVRPGVRVIPRNRLIRFIYDVEIEDGNLEALQYRAARIGYLGCADSPVKVTVTRLPHSAITIDRALEWAPDPEGSELINVHAQDDVERWAAAYDAWSKDGVTRKQALRHLPKAWYRHPKDSISTPHSGRVRVWLQFHKSIAGRKAAIVAHGLKQATLARYQQQHGDPPDWLHGHIERESDYQLARFLVLPNVGHSHSDGRIHGAAIWTPSEVDETEARNLVGALSSMEFLALGDGGQLTIDRSRRRWTATPRRWVSEGARQWVTALPAVSDRHQQIDSTSVVRWCEQAGLPKPVQYRISRKPLISGGVDLHPRETCRPGHSQNRPYAHIGLLFEEPVKGPVVIGSARSYGLGLCIPIESKGKRT